MPAAPSPDGPGPLTTLGILSSTWEVYRRELLAAVPAALVTRVPIVVSATLLVEVPLTLGHLLFGDEALALADDRLEVFAGGLLTMVWANLGHHLLSGVLEGVVGAERAGHPQPTLARTVRRSPWVRLVVADLVLTVVIFAGLLAGVLPGLLAVAYLACVMPLLGMRREDLRSVWAASARLVRGSARPVLGAVSVAWLAQALVLGAVGRATDLVTDSHAAGVLTHGATVLVVAPFVALVPAVIAFDLLERRDSAPVERR